jgi:aspartyl-tRNA(Asn)/glutamyl-tRNA(Gln) amidotransferase subunit C
MAISRQEVQKVSLLARLLLSEPELKKMTAQLGQILDYMDLLGEVDTEAVEPMAHALPVADVFREDTPEPSLDRRQALAGAPHADEECYRVPAMLGEI